MESEKFIATEDLELNLYRKFSKYKGETFFKWDLRTDKFYLTQHGYSQLFGQSLYDEFSCIILNTDIIHEDDLYLLERYLNKIFNFVGKISEELIDNEFYTTFECRLKRNNCEKYVWVKINVITKYDQAGMPVKVIGSFIDIDTQKRHQALLELQAKRDSLTGLYNKGTTETLIQEFVNQSENLQNSHALFLIDIDGFKEVNDYFGHLFGDTVINDIAMSIKKHFRTTDILGRVGGDEFVVFMKDVESDAILMNKCKLLLKELRRNYSSDKQIFMISASIGIALFPLHGNSFKNLFKQADSAMYRAKETGKDKYIIYEKNMGQPKYQNNRNQK